jgi:hypothetical protein
MAVNYDVGSDLGTLHDVGADSVAIVSETHAVSIVEERETVNTRIHTLQIPQDRINIKNIYCQIRPCHSSGR